MLADSTIESMGVLYVVNEILEFKFWGQHLVYLLVFVTSRLFFVQKDEMNMFCKGKFTFFFFL